MSTPDDVSKLAAAAFDAEMNGNVKEAIRLLDQALAAQPRGDILASRARLAEQTGDVRGAAQFAARAAESDRANAQYAQLAQRLAALVNPGSSAAAAAAPAPAPAKAAQSPSSFIPANRRAWLGTVVLGAGVLGLAGGNVWYWLLRTPPGAPRRLDPKPFAELVPMSALAIREGRAFGTVKAEWAALDGKEKRLADLAARLKSEGASAVFLADEKARMVASYRDGSARVFPAR